MLAAAYINGTSNAASIKCINIKTVDLPDNTEIEVTMVTNAAV